MSQEDIKWANDTSVTYLIYSLKTKDMKAFRVDDEKRVAEIEIQYLS
jgi:hypothetical protein